MLGRNRCHVRIHVIISHDAALLSRVHSGASIASLLLKFENIVSLDLLVLLTALAFLSLNSVGAGKLGHVGVSHSSLVLDSSKWSSIGNRSCHSSLVDLAELGHPTAVGCTHAGCASDASFRRA